MSAIIDDFTERSHHQGVSTARYHDSKAPIDRSAGIILLLASAPIIVLLMLLVRGTSRGAAIYKQRRVGKHGKEFWLYKLRTMYADAEAISGPQWARPKDSRITPVGRILRFLHLDELPQLLNVARGEMSLIGPRPERPEFVARLTRVVPNYSERLNVLPGITGLAQINLPADDSLESVTNKVILDCEYIEKGSVYLDLRILICTALRMIGIRHGRAPRWLGIEHRFAESSRSLDDRVGLSLDEAVVNVPAYINGGWKSTDNGEEPCETPAYEYSTMAAFRASSQGNKSRAYPRRPK